MPGTTDLRQFELLVERVIGILVLVFEPVNRLGRLASIARRNAQGNHDKTMRSEPTDHAFVCARFRAATRPPHDNAVFLVARKLFRISQNALVIPTRICLVNDLQQVLFFFLATREEDALRGFA